MRIQHNIMAMNAYRNYTNNVSAMKGNLEKLSSGYKINRAGDDAAGLAISEKMRAQITGLQQAQNNAKSGINLVQTAEGALQEVQDMLNRMVKLAEQSSNGTFDDGVDRKQLQKEFERLTKEIDRIGDSVNFNGITLLDGSLDGGSTTEATFAKAVADTNSVTEGGATAGVLKINAAASASTTESAVTTYDVTIGGKTYAVDKTKTTVKDQAKAWADAYNADSTTNGGKWTASSDDSGSITLTYKDDSQLSSDPADYGITGGSWADGNGSGTPSKVTGISLASASNTESSASNKYDVTIGGKTYAIDNTKTSVADQATEWAKAYNADNGNKAITDAYTVAADTSGNITFTEKTATTTADKPDALSSITGGTWTAGTAGTVATGDITIGGHTFAYAGGGSKADALTAFVADYNTNATGKGDWSAAVGTGDDAGKIVFTAKKAGAIATTQATAPAGATLTDGADAGTAGGVGKAMNLQIGDTGNIYNRISVSIKSIKSTDMYDLTTQQQIDKGETVTAMQADGVTPMAAAKKLSEIGVGTEDGAREALGALKGMVNYVSDIRGELGATQNRLNHTINNLSVMTENIQDAESTIRDTDVADEMMAYTKNNILIQSAQAMLAQANQVPQGVLQLLQ